MKGPSPSSQPWFKTTPPDQEYDICLVGAGIAGASMAAYLGSKNLKVAVIERNWEQPNEFIGELLQPSGVLKLQEMGLSKATENIDAQPIKGYAMFLDHDNYSLSYPKQGDLLKQGFGFRYGRFVQNLRSHLYGKPGVDLYDGKAFELIENDHHEIQGVKFLNNTDQVPVELRAHLTVISQGSAAPLRAKISSGKPEIKGYMLGLLLENCELPYPNYGHVFMGHPAPFLAYPVSDNKIRILVDFPKDGTKPQGEELKKHLLDVIGPRIPEQLYEAYIQAVEEGNFKFKPTSLLPAQTIFKPGSVLIGDSLNMRHPTTGAGMTVAFTDVKDLADRLFQVSDLSNKAQLNRTIKAFYRQRHNQSASMNILAFSLYRVMCHPTLRKACFEYLKQGPKTAAGPMSILSGLSRDKNTLIRHFFLVAYFAARSSLRPLPTFSRINRAYHLMKDAVHIISPLLDDEKPGLGTRFALSVGRIIFPT